MIYALVVVEYEHRVKRLEAERHSAVEEVADAKYEVQVTKSHYDELKSTSRLKVDKEEYDRMTIDFKTYVLIPSLSVCLYHHFLYA